MGAFVIKGGEIYDPAAQKWEKKDIAIENRHAFRRVPGSGCIRMQGHDRLD